MLRSIDREVGKTVLSIAKLMARLMSALLMAAVINAQTTNTVQDTGSRRGDLKVGVFKKREFKPCLKQQDFKVMVDGMPAEIVEVSEVRLPLSVMLIVNLGSNGRCGFKHISDLSYWLSTSLKPNLTPEDQIGVAVTDPEGKILLKFGASGGEWRDVFGEEIPGIYLRGIGKITLLSERNSKEYNGFRKILDSNKSSTDYNLSPIPEKLLVSQSNHLHTAFKNALPRHQPDYR